MVGNVDIKVRPLKLAYLVDPNKKAHVREAIRLGSTLWGGVYFPIIPLHKRMPKTWKDPVKAPEAKKVILGYLDAFDPDILVQFSTSVPDFVANLGLKVIKPADVWGGLGEDRNLSPKFGLGIFELLKDIFAEYFRYKSKYPVKVVLPKISGQFSLFWASLFGEISSTLLEAIERLYREPLEIETVDFAPDKLTDMLAANVFFPRRIVQRGVNTSNRAGFRRDAAAYFMDAKNLEDIVDFWNLRASGRRVLPIPKQLQSDPGLRNLVIDFLKQHRRPWRHNPNVCDYANIVKARSQTMDDLMAYASTLNITKEPDDPSDSPFFAAQHWYPRMWDEWARNRDGAVADITGEAEATVEIDTKKLRVHFKPVLPKFANEYGYHGEPRRANEISFSLYGSDDYLAGVFPKSSGENYKRAISSWASLGDDWRVGRNGLVKLVRDDFNDTRDIPTAESVVFAWLADFGWKAEVSPPGLLAKQMHRQLEGFLSILKNEKLLGLFEHMNGGLVAKDSSPVEDNKVQQERDLPIGEVRSRLQEASKRGNLYEYLVSIGVFKIGLRVQCPRCLRRSWFPLESVRDNFSCPRCLNAFSAIGTLESSEWTYKTTGPFSVPHYGEGAYNVLLTLEFFSSHNFSTMRSTPVLSFKAAGPGGTALEADAAAFWQDAVFGERKDGVFFAECKTYGQFQTKDFVRMRQLAKAFPGAVRVFSTLRKALNPQEIKGITRIAKRGRKYWKSERPINPVLVLTGTELLHFSRPPHRWEESLQKKFSHVYGLIALCEATQQIYLNLPPWQTEWHEKWEKKRKELQPKEAFTQQAGGLKTAASTTSPDPSGPASY
ncbi:MAG: hypothetical protein WA639_19950 [Candidatus Acidiferrum sp.]